MYVNYLTMHFQHRKAEEALKAVQYEIGITLRGCGARVQVKGAWAHLFKQHLDASSSGHTNNTHFIMLGQGMKQLFGLQLAANI